VLLALGCQTRNADKCNQGFDVTRQAIKANDFALAAQWREFAYKMCDPAGQDKDGLATLDKELSTAQATVKANAEKEAERKAKNDALLKLFISWAGDNRAAPEKASVAPVCDPPPADAVEAAKIAKTKEHLCTATRTAGDATLSMVDPSTTAPGHLVNGSNVLPQALQAQATSPAGNGGAFAAVSGSPLTLLTWPYPVSNDTATITFTQPIGANDALRTGNYSKTLTYTLSTTQP